MMNKKNNPRQAALALLARRDYTAQELRQKLGQRAHKLAHKQLTYKQLTYTQLNEQTEEEPTDLALSIDFDAIDTLIHEFSEKGWLSDARVAHNRSQQRANRYGAKRIQLELAQAGVATELISEAIAPLLDSEQERAKNLLIKKFKLASNEHLVYAKYYRYLASRGFSSQTIKQAIAAFQAELPNE